MKKSVDTPFLLLTCFLVVFGLLIFTSAALGLLARDGASFGSVAVSQVLFGLVFGGIAMMFFSRLDYRLIKQYTPHFFVFALFLTALTFVPHIGLSLKGASRWLSLGPFSFQPQEVLKLAAVLFLAAVYASHMRDIKKLKSSIVPLALIAGSSSALLILQPDTAGVMMICAASAAMLFAAGGRISYLVGLFAIAVIAVAALALYKPYLRARFETFLNPGSDAQGAGYQVEQSLIAVGSGGFSGRGFGQSIEKFSYLPEPIGDSIFAVAGEEFGFIGSTILVLLYAAFALLGLRIAARSPDPFGAFLVIGLVVLIAGQSLMNIGSTLGLLPLAGEPLIFVSHGGTALALALAEVGLILSVSRRMRTG
jgi:cell division protein FtsW